MTIPEESSLTLNVVWTGTVFPYLRYFVASQMAHTDARFRFVANGCDREQVDLMEEFRARHPDQVVEVLDVSSRKMVPHGTALDHVRDSRDDGDHFCLIDPDIKAKAPFIPPFARLLADHEVVTSGTEVWSDTNVIPEGQLGVSGEYFFDRDGSTFGSPHLAIYDAAALAETEARWDIGFASNGQDLTDPNSETSPAPASTSTSDTVKAMYELSPPPFRTAESTKPVTERSAQPTSSARSASG